jgi:dienelactone hydrolase
MEVINAKHTVKIAPDRQKGDLVIPKRAAGVVLFAHGSGSSRQSPRNRYVASVLQKSGLATLLTDLMTPDEEKLDRDTGHLRFDVEFLVRRLLQATDWLRQQPGTGGLPIGYFGASTGAAAALAAAAQRPSQIHAVVSRGGRPEIAGVALAHVQAPTLLIVGGKDCAVIKLNRAALAALTCEKKLSIVSGATHLFEEPGTLDQVAKLTCDWFERYLKWPSHGGR